VFRRTFLVSKLPTTAAGILGVNFLTPRQAVLDLREGIVMLCKILSGGSEPALQPMSHEGACETEWKYGLIPHVFVSNTSLKKGYMAKRNSNQTREGNVRIEKSHGRSETLLPCKPEVVLNKSDAWSVMCTHTVVLQPRPKHIVHGQVVGENLGNSP
jgi:hypothetical protein